MNERILKGKIEFFEKFGQMLNSGVPLGQSLTILANELGSEDVRKAVSDVLKNLDSADSFYACFDGNFFNESTLAMLRVAEEKGELDFICIKIASCLRAELAYIQD